MSNLLKLNKKLIEKKSVKGCGKRLASLQYFSRCGEKETTSNTIVLCTECGGKLRLKTNYFNC
jgi:hypothetical protein